MQKWFYVLELEGGHYYVGITGRGEVKRISEHLEGKGAVWTKRHKPVKVLMTHAHEVEDDAEAERLEDLMTVALMIQHGVTRVRGGHYCALDEAANEPALKAHGHWDRIRQASIKVSGAVEDWHSAAGTVLELAEDFHSYGHDPAAGDRLLFQLLAMKAHRHWHIDFEPALKEAFWGRKGVLHVLLGFKLDRVIGSGSRNGFAVLDAALQRGRGGNCPWSHLFLAAWDAFKPTASAAQDASVEALRIKHSASVRDTQYDAFVSILFPELRWRLR